MNFINLTPHKINIYNETGNQVMEIPPSGTIAKIEVTRELVEIVDDIPVYQTFTGAHSGLPNPEKGTIYIVSGMFRANYPREDLYQPGELLRNDKGQPIGCVGLSK